MLRGDLALADFQRVVQAGVRIHHLLVKVDDSAADPGDIQQVVNEFHLQFHVAANDSQRGADALGNVSFSLKLCG